MRFRSESSNSPPIDDDVEYASPQQIADDERESLLPVEGNDISSPGKAKRNPKRYFEVDRPVTSPVKVGALKPIVNLVTCKCCKWKRIWCKRVFFIIIFFLIGYLIMYQEELRLYFGYKVYAPYAVGNTTINIHRACEFKNIRSPRTLKPPNSFEPKIPIPCFDDKVSAADGFPLSRTWNVVPENSCINISNLNSNVCVESTKGSHSITCLPSFMIIGFEKASTTELLLWLSYHPNLLGKWAETRFFSKVSSPVSSCSIETSVLLCIIFLFHSGRLGK